MSIKLQGMRLALLLTIAAGAAGCGDVTGDASFHGSAFDPVANGVPLDSRITVTPEGTGRFVPVGGSGFSLFVPPGAFTQPVTFTTLPVTPRPVIGLPFPGSDSFISGLQFTSTFNTFLRPVQVLVPVPSLFAPGTLVQVFQITGDTARPITIVNVVGSSAIFSTSIPGTFFFTRASGTTPSL